MSGVPRGRSGLRRLGLFPIGGFAVRGNHFEASKKHLEWVEHRRARIRHVSGAAMTLGLRTRYCLRCKFCSTAMAGFCAIAGARLLRHSMKSA